MSYPTAQEYISLIEQFVSGRIPASTFENLYLEMFKNDEGLHPDAEFTVLDLLFGDVDRFTPDPALRDTGDLDETQLHTRAKAALDELRGLRNAT